MNDTADLRLFGHRAWTVRVRVTREARRLARLHDMVRQGSVGGDESPDPRTVQPRQARSAVRTCQVFEGWSAHHYRVPARGAGGGPHDIRPATPRDARARSE